MGERICVIMYYPFLRKQSMNQTICLVCTYQDTNWIVHEKKVYNGFVTGETVLNYGVSIKLDRPVPLYTWIRTHGYIPDEYLITGIYSSGTKNWCQIYWECDSIPLANQIRTRFVHNTSIPNRLLTTLTSDEILYCTRRV